jgi:recombination protein RecR
MDLSSKYPRALQQLIESLKVLPGVGQRSAERYAYHLFKSPQYQSDTLASSLSSLHISLKNCSHTGELIDSLSDCAPSYNNPSRNKQIVCIVADSFDAWSIEKTGVFHGTYHVLGGLISPIDNIGPENLNFDNLIDRIKNDRVIELVIATNASVEGDTTALYIQNLLGKSELQVPITRLARGLSVGTELEYADSLSLSRALEGRQTL